MKKNSIELVNPKIREYIEEYIFPSYERNESGHGLSHIKYVIDRSFMFANEVKDINLDMVYVIESYHDIGHYIDAKNHEKVSAKILLDDKKLKEFFSTEEIKTMADAVYDHRSSMKGDPRSIYGKIVSSADRNTLIEEPLKRTYSYRIEHGVGGTMEDVIEESRQHLIDKFGKKGYATEKMYFEDKDYKKFLEDISKLAKDKKEFKREFMEINGLNNKLKYTFDEIKRLNKDLSLDQVLYKTYKKLNDKRTFDIVRKEILEATNINELNYYTSMVDTSLKKYIKDNIFIEYDKNDILEVIRRMFAFNDTFKLELDPNIMYTIAACHNRGKYIDHENNNSIDLFIKDKYFKNFFTTEERKLIKEAIEDYKSSKKEQPRSPYGKAISSIDKNTSIDTVLLEKSLS